MLTATLLAALAAPTPAPLAPPAPAYVLAEDVATLVARGREHIEAGRLAEARADLERAAAQDSSFATAMWILRLEIAEGTQDDVLGKLSKLRREGRRGADMDYLAGLALTAQAEAEIAAGGGSSTGLILQDAESKLRSALEADAALFADAWLVHARVARMVGDNERSLTSARRAAERSPQSVAAQDLIGRAALALFAPRYAEDPRPDEVTALQSEALRAFARGIELAGTPREYADQTVLAGLWSSLGTLYAFDADIDAARAAYGEALGWDPNAVDIGSIRGTLGDQFAPALQFGAERFAQHHGDRDVRDATLQWWLGWALYNGGDREQLEAAATAFSTSVQKWPAFTNAWYWLARIRYDQQDYGASIAALRENWMSSRDDLIASVSATALDADRVEYMVGWCAGNGANFDAAFLSEVLCAVRPDVARYWNNLGLFLRDANEALSRDLEADDEEGWAEVRRGWERSYEAYSKALEIAPENPAFLNDGAVLLHYYLERDYDQAFAMYDRAKELAEAQLEAGKLSAEERPIVEIALRDAVNNRRFLEQKIAAEREAESGEG